jgi:thiol-disulfide isomerase/thioredoxin
MIDKLTFDSEAKEIIMTKTSTKELKMIDLNEDKLDEFVKSHQKVLVQYGATWCGNCRMIKPKIKNMAPEFADVTFVYVDAEKYPESRQLADVSNLPTFAFFKDGALVNQAQGNKIDVVKGLIE